MDSDENIKMLRLSGKRKYRVPLLVQRITKTAFWALILASLWYSHCTAGQDNIEWYLPIETQHRLSLENVQLTSIGRFGLTRKARPGIPVHLHTGIDLKRPTPNYAYEPVYPAAAGKVISLREDGPYAQIIIEHTLADDTVLWTVYEHIAEIRVRVNERVHPHRPIARFMTKDELDQYGWQFDHLHFEIMKAKPPPCKPDNEKPFHYFGTYCLICYTQADLGKRYYDPISFFKQHWIAWQWRRDN